MKLSSSPERTCIACRSKQEQSSLLRVTLDRNMRLGVIERGPSFARSAYVCPTLTCIETAFGKGRFERALRRRLSADDVRTIKSDLECKLKRKQTI